MSFDIASGLYENKPRRKKAQRKSIYDQQREEETIRNATNRGYLRRMTVEFLNDNVGIDHHELTFVGYLNVTAQQLRSLGALEICIRLRICILPGNYITEFDALGSCVNLWTLDLHGNQIKKVPEHTFWSALNQLEIVMLHDNGISKLETIRNLSSSPCLTILTLYDTPLSLKKNYRHHIVNGIWSLKALDFHVISDEEIIEDAEMPGPFAALQSNFKVNIAHTLTKESSLQDAVKQMEEIKRKVNGIQGKYCPVLLIQKTFRMFAIRKRYKYLMATRVWAATSIQRFFRFHKGRSKSREDVLPPPTSPYVPPDYDAELDSYKTLTHGESDKGPGGLEQHESSDSSRNVGGSSIHVPVVNYISVGEGISSSLKGESSGSVGRNQTSTASGSKGSSDTVGKSKISLDSRVLKPENLSCSTVNLNVDRSSRSLAKLDSKKKVTRRMTIDLMKLESSTIGTIESATCDVTMDSGLGLDKKSKSPKDSKSKTNVSQNEGDVVLIEQRKPKDEQDDALYKRRLKPEKVGKYRTVRVFLGDVVETKPKVVTDSDEDETIGFRLQGEEPPKQKNEPIVDMLLSKKEMGEDVRKSLREFRRKQPEKPRKVAGGSMKLTNDQMLFLRTHGTMGLACLRAVHQAYGDRARAQKQADLNERVAGMKERRDLGIERLQSIKQEYQENVLRDRIRDGVKIADSLRENEAKQDEERRKVSERREAAMVENRIRQSHLSFAREFACQQNSVSQALRNHDRTEAKKEKQKKMAEAVRLEREGNAEKQALVRKYMEHRRLMNQAEMSKVKAEINTKLLDEANKQFMEVQTNMKRTKTRQSKVTEFYPLPPINAPDHNTPLAILSPALLDQWEECLHRDSRHFDDMFSVNSSENVC